MTRGTDLSQRADRSPSLIGWRHRGILIAVSFMLIVTIGEIANFMPVPLYGAMSAELGLTSSTVSWVVLASAVAGAACTPLLARLVTFMNTGESSSCGS